VNELIPLEMMSWGEWAEVAEITGEPAWIGRLAEMGIRHGARLQIVQPGSPCILQIGGARLSLRGDLALQILVRPLAAVA